MFHKSDFAVPQKVLVKSTCVCMSNFTQLFDKLIHQFFEDEVASQSGQEC